MTIVIALICLDANDSILETVANYVFLQLHLNSTLMC